jgi:hypothetical protein
VSGQRYWEGLSDVVILHLYYAVVPTGSEEGVDVETNYASYGWRLS